MTLHLSVATPNAAALTFALEQMFSTRPPWWLTWTTSGFYRRGKGGSVTGSAPIVNAADLPSDFGKQLEIAGHVILSDLVFDTGSAELGEGPFDSLAKLADYLRANPTRRIALVGHTDAVGGLDGNIALSKRRAASVRARMTNTLGVPEAQLVAEGVGFLAPVANNLSGAGREANRRVEAVLISTE